jgi:ATP-dependent helicase/DNAse subunit B
VPSPVELIVGPARSGKAGYVLAAYHAALAKAGPGKCLMLVPTALRRRATESRLLAAEKSGVLVRPQILEMHELADRLLAAAGRPVRRIGDLARRQVIRHCLAHLDEKQAAVLGPVRDSPGLVEALDGLFRELKAARVEPDVFGRALVGEMRTPRNRLLAILYGEYQKALQAREVYDDAGQFWHAADVVAKGEFGPMADLAILVVDGFQDLAPAQLDMLAALSSQAARTLITLTWEPGRGRENLFGVTGRTRLRLRERFADRLREITVDEPAGLPPDLERVRRRLFALPDADAARPKAAGAIAVVQAAGRTREVEEVARQIADLLRAGASTTTQLKPSRGGSPDPPREERGYEFGNGVCAAGPETRRAKRRCSTSDTEEKGTAPFLAKPASIAVIVRSTEGYAALVRQVFPRYGFPFRVEAGRRLSECPIVRAAMALVRLQVEDYSFRALGRLVKSNYFDAAAFGADAATARQALRLAREANVWEGRKRYAEQLEYLRSRARRSADVLDDDGEAALPADRAAERLKEIDADAAFLEQLFGRLELPAKAPRRTLAERLRDNLRAAGLWAAARTAEVPNAACGTAGLSSRGGAAATFPTAGQASRATTSGLVLSECEGRARDLKALAAFEHVLGEVALLDEGQASEVTLEDFLKEVQQGLALTTVPAEEPRDTPVVVLDVRHCRSLSFDHVFLLGLAEKEFPRRGRRHPFFDDAERRDLRGKGVDLPDAGHAAQQEMLLAYVAMTRARRTLTVTYPSLDSQGRPTLGSHYLEELFALFAAEKGPSLPVAEIGARDLALPLARLRAGRELLAKTMFELWGPGKAEHADEHMGILDAMLARSPAATETALAGLAAEWEREHGERFGPMDGVLSAPEIIDELCRRYPGQAPMSAHRLEAFGACPFAFFAGELLGLAQIEEPTPDLGPMDLGTIYHGLLQRFFTALGASKTASGRLTDETWDEALAILDQAAAAYFRQLEAGGHIGSPALWKVRKPCILRDVRRMLAWQREKLSEWRVAHLEVTFGARTSAPVPPPGLREPISLASPHGPIRIRGRIDRIDLPADGSAGFQVIDYKTGSAPTATNMAEGTSFQLPIYIWACEEILPKEERAGRVLAFFLPIRSPRKSGALTSTDAKGNPNEKYERALARAAEYIRRFSDTMRRGIFPVYPRASSGCPEYCAFHEICRFAEWRIEHKRELHPIAQLEMIADGDEAGENEA